MNGLREAAQRDRRTMTQEIVYLLDVALCGLPKAVAAPDAKAQVAAWRKLAGKWESGREADR